MSDNDDYGDVSPSTGSTHKVSDEVGEGFVKRPIGFIWEEEEKVVQSVDERGLELLHSGRDNPIMVGDKPLFGYYLPYIGFETQTVTKESFERVFGVVATKDVSGEFFTVEWFGRGFSFGAFKPTVKE